MGYVHERGYACGLNLTHEQWPGSPSGSWLDDEDHPTLQARPVARARTHGAAMLTIPHIPKDDYAPAVARSGEPLQDRSARCRHSAVRPC